MKTHVFFSRTRCVNVVRDWPLYKLHNYTEHTVARLIYFDFCDIICDNILVKSSFNYFISRFHGVIAPCLSSIVEITIYVFLVVTIHQEQIISSEMCKIQLTDILQCEYLITTNDLFALRQASYQHVLKNVDFGEQEIVHRYTHTIWLSYDK